MTVTYCIGKCIDTGRCKENWYECLTLLTLNIQLTTRVNHYPNTRLSNWKKELGNEYIATEAEAPKEEPVASLVPSLSPRENEKGGRGLGMRLVCGFCSRNCFKVDVLKSGLSAVRVTFCKK